MRLLCFPAVQAVLQGMELVYRIEKLGSREGKTSGVVKVVDAGELPLLRQHSRPQAGHASGPDSTAEEEEQLE